MPVSDGKNLPSDQRDLIDRCNRGEKDAWEEFYRTYIGMITRVVKTAFPDRSGEREEIVQEVFIQLFSALKRFDPARSIEAYILEIARRARISGLRKITAKKRGGAHSSHLPLDTHGGGSEMGYVAIKSTELDQESLLTQAEEERFLRKSLGKLSAACRELLGLRYDRGLAYKEIGEILGIKEGTLRVRVQRCLASLGALYSELTGQEVEHR